MKNSKLIYPPEGGALYHCNFIINGYKITNLIISNHYKKKHASYMSDELIIKFIENHLDSEIFTEGKKQGI